MSEFNSNTFNTARPVDPAVAPPTAVPYETASQFPSSRSYDLSGNNTVSSVNPSSTTPATTTVYPASKFDSTQSDVAQSDVPRSDISEASSISSASNIRPERQATVPPVLGHSVAPRPDAFGTTLSVPVHQPVLTATGAPDVTARCDPLPPAPPLFPTKASNVLEPTSIAHPMNSSYDDTANMQATGAPAHPFYISKQTNAALASADTVRPLMSEIKLGDNSGPQYNTSTDTKYPTDTTGTAGPYGNEYNAGTATTTVPPSVGATSLTAADVPANQARRSSSSSSSSGSSQGNETVEGHRVKKNTFFNATLLHETKVPAHPLPDPTKYGPAPVSHPALIPPQQPIDNSPRQVIQASGSVVPCATVATPDDSFIVHLSHPNGEPLGMNICSEDLHFTGVYITEVDPYGLAAKSGRIARGLFIQAVNGKSTIELKHADIVREMALPEVDLLLSLHPFEKRASVVAPAIGHVPVEATAENIEPQAFSGERNVIIDKDEEGQVGLRLQGVRGVCVSAIIRGSPASRSTIQIDDKLIAVNGTNVVNATIEEIVSLFRQSPRVLTLTVVTPITKRVSALGVFSGPNLAKGKLKEEEIAFASALDRDKPSNAMGMGATDPAYPVAGSTLDTTTTTTYPEGAVASTDPAFARTDATLPAESSYRTDPMLHGSSTYSTYPKSTTTTTSEPIADETAVPAWKSGEMHVDPVTGMKTYGI